MKVIKGNIDGSKILQEITCDRDLEDTQYIARIQSDDRKFRDAEPKVVGRFDIILSIL